MDGPFTFGNGFLFANWAARIPQVRAELGVTPGALGLILGCLAVGAGIGTSLSGLIISRLGEIRTVWAARRRVSPR